MKTKSWTIKTPKDEKYIMEVLESIKELLENGKKVFIKVEEDKYEGN